MAGRLNLEGLRYAQGVARTGSFSAAARAHGVTQPALSNGIARLEDYLHGPLFTRSPRGVTPTPFGIQVLPLIDRALSALDAVTAEARRWSAPATESIRVGVSPLINPDLVARTYRAVRELPGPATPPQLVLREANMAELRDGLVAGELDFIIVPSVGPMPRYEHRIIDSEPLVLVERNADADGPAALADLAGRQLILMPDTCGLTRFTRDLLEERALPVKAYPGEAATYRVLEDWSRLALGSAMLPESKLRDRAAAHRTVLDEDGMTIEIFYEVAWNPTSPMAGQLQELASRLTPPAD